MDRLQLNPQIQTVWVSPTELRFGIDERLASLENPPPRVERLIDALRTGMPATHLPHIAKAFGVSAKERDDLLTALEPVLLRGPAQSAQESRAVHLVLDGSPDLTSPLTPMLTDAGFTLHSDNATDVAIVLSHFATPLTRARTWATRGTPHLEVVFSELQVRIGPFAGLDSNACVLCAQLHLADREPSWPAMASQCLGRRAATAEAGFIAITAGVILSVLSDWRRDGLALTGTQIVIERDRERGFALRTESLSPHERCDCQRLLS